MGVPVGRRPGGFSIERNKRINMNADFLEHNTEIKGLEPNSVVDFWRWAYSDILSNTNRAIFAEFIVGAALGAIDKPRVEWDAYDLYYKGKKIEVKSTGFIQSWKQNGISRPVFDIAKKHAWNPDDNTYSPEKVRFADCYVFCIFKCKDKNCCDLLDMDNWEFFVLSREEIEMRFGDQKTVALSRLRIFAKPVSIKELRIKVDKVLNCILTGEGLLRGCSLFQRQV